MQGNALKDPAQECSSDDEYKTRVELAAALRLTAMFGWDLICWNHISAKVPGREDHFLINPLGMRFDEVSASSLVKVDIDGNLIDGDGDAARFGFVIHSAIHKARQDVMAVMHTHTIDGVAVASMKEGLLPLSMESLYLYGRIAYHENEGASVNLDERETLGREFGDKNVAMLLRNHGLLTTGQSIGECFTLMYNLQRACEIQVKLMSSGAEIVQVAPCVIEEYTAQMGRRSNDPTADFRPGRHEWPALLRKLDSVDTSYKD